ncbi:helix-turn-helix domain-containing protein [Microvirga tunisiensis]|uniref:Helix-turn-helix domain-containing protein n=2 Tax=Pannonibacter tanglangensis TaxID=2750084 RepID=A0ABW9ZIH6_9HYPH|nr:MULTISPECIES: AraC family transcriptional regulator [unclassified Pannonibacter]NBN63853.1 helix-turn-helix domain-containing protein [Pannonibacter sp. XCT-34]NBN77492.1 helix-turn-helix domain-containing protein [Pannonibacter sp. XCT-53]
MSGWRRGASIRARTFITIPRGMGTEWHLPTGQPRVLHLHIGTELQDMLAEDCGRGRAGSTLTPRIGWEIARTAALFDRLAILASRTDEIDRLELQGLGLVAAAHVLKASSTLGPGSPGQTMTPARMRRVRAYVEENLGRGICLEDMAGCIGLSPSHFSRSFRLETGLSPYAWVLQARITRVKDLLLRGRLTLAEIAIECGFATQSHMTEAFRRATGVPPARWLREQGSDRGEALR